MTVDLAEKYPVLTFASGPTNSMREAAPKAAKSEVCASADTPEVRSIDEVPLAYLPGGALRIKAKAIGGLVGIGA